MILKITDPFDLFYWVERAVNKGNANGDIADAWEGFKYETAERVGWQFQFQNSPDEWMPWRNVPEDNVEFFEHHRLMETPTYRFRPLYAGDVE